MTERAISYWCLPRAEDGAHSAEIIAALAAAQGAPVFAPHLTLATLHAAAADVIPVLNALRGLTLDPIGLDGTEVFTTALFLRFRAAPQLLAARALMEAHPAFRRGRAYDPHMSLCYGPPPERTELEPQIAALLARPVRFDRLAAVEVAVPSLTPADVAAWRMGSVYSF